MLKPPEARALPLSGRLAAAIYPQLRRILFRMDAEDAHHRTMVACRFMGPIAGLLAGRLPSLPVRCMGLNFPNPVGLAAGLDKDGIAVEALGAMGFGFLEIGTVTPRPQPGNDMPRLFRIVEKKAIVNRMGFNNDGVDAMVARLKKRRYRGVLGINIGKNKVTENVNALDDYLYCLRAASPVADYVAVNFSSPNTPGLRELQGAAMLRELLLPLKEEQGRLEDKLGKYTPMAVKIAPDLSEGEIESMAAVFEEVGIDGVIATNTTLSRAGVGDSPVAAEAGGLSGAPLRDKASEVIASLRRALDPAIPIIGVGGILNGVDAREKRDAGAELVQIYTGFIYRGPALIREVLENW